MLPCHGLNACVLVVGMAGEFAMRVKAEQLVLTHFSSRYRSQEVIDYTT